ncbi:MAG TPA: ATP synthase F1 subunit delta [Pirellulales bacterium]|jgi:F-type H+-transporting ATPase subunit delta|nr:ATP synthase F1 subunit delta [Pirellulales bacterium]
MTKSAKRTFSNPYVNVGAQQVATVYASALVDAAEAAGKTEAVMSELDSFIADVLAVVPHFESVLGSALVSADEKNALLDKALRGQASPVFLNFLKVVARHGRLDILRPIHQAAHTLFDRMRGVTRVQVASASELDDGLTRQLTDSVRKMLGGVPMLEKEVWPELVGGMMMRVGDTVYDASISTRLERIRQTMIDRSVHEIQSRRDRFSSAEGN